MTAVLTQTQPVAVAKPSLKSSRFDLPQFNTVSKDESCRLNLKKRVVGSTQEKVNLSTYNSAFLKGLFADVAAAKDNSTETSELCTAIPYQDEIEIRFDNSLSVKRSRLSSTKSISRVGRSYKKLTNLCLDDSQNEIELKPAKCSMERLESLHYQLNELGSENDISPKSVVTVLDIGVNAFPKLPASFASEASCKKDLTRKDDIALSTSETNHLNIKESYGWFVAMDDGENHHEDVDPYLSTNANLAFSAPTAPKRSNLDEELEWAKAADTVDDVLGDFF